MGEKEEEEDYGALIYRESQLRKAEAAAAAAAAAKDAKKKKKKKAAAGFSTRRRVASTRAVSAAIRHKSSVNIVQRKNASKRKRDRSKLSANVSKEDDEVARKRARWREYKKKCSADGCNQSSPEWRSLH